MDINLTTHISLTASDDIQKLCRQFFQRKRLIIDHLNYIHQFPDGDVFYLCSNHAWIKHYISNCYMEIGAFENQPLLSKSRYVLWDSLDSDDIILKDSRELIFVDHGLTVIHSSREGTGFFNFGRMHADITHLNTYINNLAVLEEFILYFYANTEHFFKVGKQQRIVLPEKNHRQHPKNMPHLTQREIQCVYWYLQGKTSGEIAIILDISRRTVETHIENIKIKFNCNNLFQLGYYLANQKFPTAP